MKNELPGASEKVAELSASSTRRSGKGGPGSYPGTLGHQRDSGGIWCARVLSEYGKDFIDSSNVELTIVIMLIMAL